MFLFFLNLKTEKRKFIVLKKVRNIVLKKLF